jgi:membrane-bound lytic murein transglycosylase A
VLPAAAQRRNRLRVSSKRRFLAVAATALVAIASVPSQAQRNGVHPMTRPAAGETIEANGLRLVPISFDRVPGWADDDHAPALRAFRASCAIITASPREAAPGLIAMCARAETAPASAARAFFEANFTAHSIVDGSRGFLTGYFEPVVRGSRVRTPTFRFPLHRRPPDLVNLVDEAARAGAGTNLTHARRLPDGKTAPYATRAEIESGALDGQGLEIVWLSDPVDRFFMQVQGSGRVRLDDGSTMRLGYDGKTGHPYTSIGRVLIDDGIMRAQDVTLQSLGTWLRANPKRARDVMWRNQSYVFFRDMGAAGGPVGALGSKLTPGRSLAVDPRYHPLGLPVWVVSETLRTTGDKPFRRLMVAQDVGSAIKGPQRGDIYFGSGAAAGAKAGRTKHAGQFVVLLPRGSGQR